MHVCEYRVATLPVEAEEDLGWGSSPPSHRTGSGGGTQVVRPVRTHLYPVSHLSSPLHTLCPLGSGSHAENKSQASSQASSLK